MHISLAFLNKGDQVLVPNPGYPTYASASKIVEANIIHYDLSPENNWLPNLASIEKNIYQRLRSCGLTILICLLEPMQL